MRDELHGQFVSLFSAKKFVSENLRIQKYKSTLIIEQW